MSLEKDNPLVSVLIPVYGVEKQVKRCIESLLAQKYPNFEVVIVNDCTKDKSVEIIESILLEACFDYRIIHHVENKGIAVTRNTLLDNARGEYILFLDGDDYLVDNAIMTYVNIAIEKKSDIVVSNYYSEVNGERTNKKVKVYLDSTEYIEKSLLRQSSFNLCFKIIRASLFNDIKFIPNINMGEDYLIFPKILQRAHIITYIDNPLYVYVRENKNSYTTNITNSQVYDLFNGQKNMNDYFYDLEIIKSSNSMSLVDTLKITRNNQSAYNLACKVYKNFQYSYSRLTILNKIILFLYKLGLKNILRYSLLLGFYLKHGK